MTPELHPLAPEHLPSFVTPPGQTDTLFLVLGIATAVGLLLLGTLYFRLHALPEHMAHRSQHTQMQLVGVLAVLALFTHNNVFWVLALLIAALRVPDFVSPLRSIARSLGVMAERTREAEAEMAETPREAAGELAAAPAADPARRDLAGTAADAGPRHPRADESTDRPATAAREV